jgi:hypothetical protein
MENRKAAHPEHDHSVADEHYHGPSLGVTAVGYNAVQWKIGIAVGGVIGFAAALLMPQKVGAGVKAIEGWIGKRIALGQTSRIEFGKTISIDKGTGPTAGNWFTHGVAQFTNWSLRQADHVGEWAKKSLDNSFAQKIGLNADRVEKGMLGFGIGGFIGMFLSMFTSSAQAYRVNHKAHDQFHRAQNEIRDLRSENDALRAKNAVIKAECDPVPRALSMPENAFIKKEEPPREIPDTIIRKELALAPEARLAAPQHLAAL